MGSRKPLLHSFAPFGREETRFWVWGFDLWTITHAYDHASSDLADPKRYSRFSGPMPRCSRAGGGSSEPGLSSRRQRPNLHGYLTVLCSSSAGKHHDISLLHLISALRPPRPDTHLEPSAPQRTWHAPRAASQDHHPELSPSPPLGNRRAAQNPPHQAWRDF